MSSLLKRRAFLLFLAQASPRQEGGGQATTTSTAKISGTQCRPIGLGNARIGTTRPQEELVSRTNEPETINNMACVRTEKAKVDNAAACVPLNARPIRDVTARRATYKPRRLGNSSHQSKRGEPKLPCNDLAVKSSSDTFKIV